MKWAFHAWFFKKNKVIMFQSAHNQGVMGRLIFYVLCNSWVLQMRLKMRLQMHDFSEVRRVGGVCSFSTNA
jgi:hypothetical protein